MKRMDVRRERNAGSGSLERLQQTVTEAISPRPKVKGGNELYRAGINGAEVAAIRDEFQRLGAEDQDRARQFAASLGFSERTVRRLFDAKQSQRPSGPGAALINSQGQG